MRNTEFSKWMPSQLRANCSLSHTEIPNHSQLLNVCVLVQWKEKNRYYWWFILVTLSTSDLKTEHGKANTKQIIEALDYGLWHCRFLCRRTKVKVFKSLVLPVLLYRCETWTLTKDLRWRLNSFGTRSLRRILVYHWSDFVSNDRLLRERLK